MSTITEAEELFGTFLKLWRAGKKARLNIKCHAGKVWATLRVYVPQQHHQPHWRVGPSRLRRHARRAASRDQAAVEAAEDIVIHVTEKVTYETGISVNC